MSRKSLLKDFVKPNKAIYETLEENEFVGKFVAYPLERGFGTTIGNSLRRALLSSIQGYAISAIKVIYKKDEKTIFLSSQFDQIYGVKEDTYEIINNLKQLSLTYNLEENLSFSLSFEGRQDVKAEVFEKISGIKVYNKDLHLFTLMKDASLEIEFELRFSRGYVTEEMNKKYVEDVNVIAIDSIFSPVKSVNFKTESMRVGDRTDYDKLFLEVSTNGSIKPADAIGEAAKLLKESLDLFINFDETELKVEETTSKEDEALERLLKTSIEDLKLSVRAFNCLKSINVKNLEGLVRKTEEEMIKTKNFGKKSLSEIKEKLKTWNLSLGIKDLNILKNTIKLSKTEND